MKILICVVALLFSSQAFADCESVIALSRLTKKNISDESSVQRDASAFCDEQSQSNNQGSSGSLGVKFGGESFNLGGSSASNSDLKRRYCSSSDSSKAVENAYKAYIEDIAPGAYEAYQRCLEMASSDVRFRVNVSTILGNEFTMFASYSGTMIDSPRAVMEITTSEDVECKWSGLQGNQAQLQPGSTAPIVCRRSQRKTDSYVTIAQTNVSDSEPLSMRWKASTADGTPVDEIEGMRRQLSDLQDGYAELVGQLATGSLYGGAYAVQDDVCPMMDSRENQVTGNLGCPRGFTSHVSGRVRGSESNCGVTLFVCLKKL